MELRNNSHIKIKAERAGRNESRREV